MHRLSGLPVEAEVVAVAFKDPDERVFAIPSMRGFTAKPVIADHVHFNELRAPGFIHGLAQALICALGLFICVTGDQHVENLAEGEGQDV